MVIKHKINEGGGSYADVRGVRGSGTVRLSCHQLHGKQKGILLSEIALPDLGEGEACDVRLPIPPMPAEEKYVLLVELDSGSRQDTLMPAPDAEIHLKVVPRAYVDDKEEAWPPEPLNGSVVSVRTATDGEIEMDVRGPAGEHAGPSSTHVLGLGLPGPPGPMPRHETRQKEGRTQIRYQTGGETGEPVWGEWLSLEGDPGPQGEGTQEARGETLTAAWLQRLVPLASVTSSTYDDAGRLSSEEGAYADGSAGTYSADYDDGGRLTSETYTHAESGQQLALAHEYDSAGRLASTTPQVTSL